MINIFTIPAQYSFVDILASELIKEVQITDSPELSLSKYTIFLPTRRACRNLQEAFLRISNGKPILLPKMLALGDIDAEELQLLNPESALIQNSISKLRRNLILAKMIMQMPDMVSSFDQAVELANSLGSFLDQAKMYQVSFDKLEEIVPEEFSEHWQITLSFLKIITEFWPNILAELNLLDETDRRNLLIENQIELWQRNPPKNPIIVAGSTGSIPSNIALLKTIANMDNGSVILPGLDINIDEDSYDFIGEDHAQYEMKNLLDKIGIRPSEVKNWKDLSHNISRSNLISEIMRPSETTDKWQEIDDIDESSINGIQYIECESAQEEANIIALKLRETLEIPEKTAALITPDRNLAKRVALSLRRWGIDIDDSGGTPLNNSPVGVWIQLVADMVIQEFSPIAILACLKHPFAAGGLKIFEFNQFVSRLETHVLRGGRPDKGFIGLYNLLDKNLEKDQELIAWLKSLEEKCQDFIDILQLGDKVEFKSLLTQNIKLAENLASNDEKQGIEIIWSREDGESAANFINEVLEVADNIPEITGFEYLGLIRSLMKPITVRPKYGQHPRLTILGKIESRLYKTDLTIVSGLNEKTWPAEPSIDPWLSRQMRRNFGLPSIDKNIGVDAHDFTQAISGKEVIITRSLKQSGTPTVQSRWLSRLNTVLSSISLELAKKPEVNLKAWARKLDEPIEIASCTRPEPSPALNTRPKRLSVTEIETLMRDPYAIYAKHILKLRALEELESEISVADKGNYIHQALEEFIENYDLNNNSYNDLIKTGMAIFDKAQIPMEVKAFWSPRFKKMAYDFINNEREWRLENTPFKTEIKGQLKIDDIDFTLTARADRIDKNQNGAYAIIDYKTGAIPNVEDVKLGFSPQLPLEAVIIRKGGFAGINANDTEYFGYWKVAGSKDKIQCRYFSDPKIISTIIDEAEIGLINLIKSYNNENAPYISLPRQDKEPRYSDYRHLSRALEWQAD